MSSYLIIVVRNMNCILKVEDLNREESFLHNLHQLSNDLRCDVLPHKHELEKSNEEAGIFPITSISNFYESEELVSLDSHGYG